MQRLTYSVRAKKKRISKKIKRTPTKITEKEAVKFKNFQKRKDEKRWIPEIENGF